jgi:hypothetical protein
MYLLLISLTRFSGNRSSLPIRYALRELSLWRIVHLLVWCCPTSDRSSRMPFFDSWRVSWGESIFLLTKFGGFLLMWYHPRHRFEISFTLLSTLSDVTSHQSCKQSLWMLLERIDHWLFIEYSTSPFQEDNQFNKKASWPSLFSSARTYVRCQETMIIATVRQGRSSFSFSISAWTFEYNINIMCDGEVTRSQSSRLVLMILDHLSMNTTIHRHCHSTWF